MLEKRVLTILELNWNQRLGHREDKIEHLSLYAHVVHTTAKLVISRPGKNENVFKLSKDEICTCKACKKYCFHCQICKFVGFLLPSSSWLLKLPMCCRVGGQVKHEKLDLKRVYKLRVKFLPQEHNEADVWSSKPQLRSLFPMVILRLSLFDALAV